MHLLFPVSILLPGYMNALCQSRLRYSFFLPQITKLFCQIHFYAPCFTGNPAPKKPLSVYIGAISGCHAPIFSFRRAGGFLSRAVPQQRHGTGILLSLSVHGGAATRPLLRQWHASQGGRFLISSHKSVRS